MLDDKIKACIIEKFKKAAKEFNFNFVAPYCIGEKKNYVFFCHLFKAKPLKGVVIDIICHFEDEDVEKLNYCKENNIFYSRLNVTPLLGEYDASYFCEMLEDWEYEF